MIEVDVEITNKWYGYKAVIGVDCPGRRTRRIVVRAVTMGGLINKIKRRTGLVV